MNAADIPKLQELLKALPADEKEAWIEAGQPDIAEDYTIPLYRNARSDTPS